MVKEKSKDRTLPQLFRYITPCRVNVVLKSGRSEAGDLTEIDFQMNLTLNIGGETTKTIRGSTVNYIELEGNEPISRRIRQAQQRAREARQKYQRGIRKHRK